MVVDDEKDILATTSSALKKKGYAVRSFDSGQAAIEHVKKVGCHECSILLSDIRMPRVDGFELSRQIKAMCPSTKIILVTAYPVTELELKSVVPSTIDGLLQKPFSMARLLEVIGKLVEEKKRTLS